MDEARRLIERARETAEEARRIRAETRRIVQTSREIQRWTARVQGRVAGQTGAIFSFNRLSNCLLAILPTSEFNRLTPVLQGVAFAAKQVLHRANGPVEHVYFPISGLLSATITMRDGRTIGISTIGNEGVAGLPAGIENYIVPHDLTVQVPGFGLRMAAPTLQAELMRGGLLREVLAGYQSACAVQDAYQIACNGLHDSAKRCCRQLLSFQDRLASDVIPLTHESLALILGVRRATVTEELTSLQAQGAIETQRGQITIIDRPKLRSLACECYDTITQEFDRLFQSPAMKMT